jgi:hypothetical protein
MIKKKKIIIILLTLIIISCFAVTVFFYTKNKQREIKAFDIEAVGNRFGSITMDCTYDDENHELSVSQTVEYINQTKNVLTEIMFHIYANAYKERAKFPPVAKNEIEDAYPNGASYGGIEIKSVSGGSHYVEGTDQTILTVHLYSYLLPQAKRTIKINYVVKLANIKHRLGWTDNFVNLGNFYPVPAVHDQVWKTHNYSSNGDPFYNDLYNFDVKISAPADYIIAHSGDEISPKHYRAFAIRDFAMVLSKDFKILTDKVGFTTVNYYYAADSMAEISLQTAVKALDYFSRQFWQYPYTTLAVVQTDFLHGGMEYGTLVYISADIDTETLSYQTVIVHEIAHQWWYGIVGNDQTKTAWIDEGLAEYSTAVFFETHPEYGQRIDKIAASNFSTLAMYDELLGKLDITFDKSMNRDINNFGSGYEYTFCTYCRGMLLFYNIAKMIGYEQFNKGLSAFAVRQRFTFGTQNDLISTLEDTFNTKLGTYFNNYLAG